MSFKRHSEIKIRTGVFIFRLGELLRMLSDEKKIKGFLPNYHVSVENRQKK